MTERPSITWTGLAVDCSDAEQLAAFYARLFGWTITDRDGGWLQLHGPDGAIHLNVQQEDGYEPPIWPERPGRQAKMMHFEVLVSDVPAAVERVVELGGSEARHQPADRDRSRLRVMLDPAGHPFCVFVDGE
jgi:predicted enzyme related to lactoylglutathione lyase